MVKVGNHLGDDAIQRQGKVSLEGLDATGHLFVPSAVIRKIMTSHSSTEVFGPWPEMVDCSIHPT